MEGDCSEFFQVPIEVHRGARPSSSVPIDAYRRARNSSKPQYLGRFMSLSSPPPKLVFCDSALDDVTFGKWPFEKMSGRLRKNSEPLLRSWDLEELRALF